MRVERQQHETCVMLEQQELHLLKRALERASFIDTPVAEQADIAAFCAKALEALRDKTA